MYLQQLAALPRDAMAAAQGMGTGGSRRSASALEEELSALEVTPRGALGARPGAATTVGRHGPPGPEQVQVVPPKRGGPAKGFGGAQGGGEVLPVEFRDLNTTEAASGVGQQQDKGEAWDVQAAAADIMAAFAQAEAGVSGAAGGPAAAAPTSAASAQPAPVPEVQVDVRSTRGEAKGGRAPFKRRRQEGQAGRAPAPGQSTMAATAELLQSLGMQGLPRVPTGAVGQQVQGQQQRQRQHVEVEVEMDGGEAAASVASAWAAANGVGGGGGGARMNPEDPRTWNLLDAELGAGPGAAGGRPIEVVEPEVVEP